MKVVRERGSILPLAAVVLMIAAVAMLLVVELAVRAAERAEAQTAADMAALAGVYEGRTGALEIAELNGAVLLSYQSVDDLVLVEVAVNGTRAEAAAVWDPDVSQNVETERVG